MTLVTLTIILAAICFLICSIFIATQVFGPSAQRLLSLSSGLNSLQDRVFPLIAFFGLLCILTKITVF